MGGTAYRPCLRGFWGRFSEVLRAREGVGRGVYVKPASGNRKGLSLKSFFADATVDAFRLAIH
jgi:hypothetical protein